MFKMPRRCNNPSDDDPPKKKICTGSTSSFDIQHGEFLKDITGKQWKLGKAVGVGGFGEIYLASDVLAKDVKTDSKYVAKVESHKNGPLFVEVNCYLRIAKPDMIEKWKKQKKKTWLGMPHYVASGSHIHKGERYRFLILPRYKGDLEKILQEKKKLNLKTVLTISSQIIDVLEYIHSMGYIHSDIKASNILLSNSEISEKSRVVQHSRNKYRVCNPMRTCRIPRIPKRLSHLRPKVHVNYDEDISHIEELFSPEIDAYINLEESKTKRDQAYLLDYGLTCKFLTRDGDHKPFCVDARKAHAGTILFCSRDAHNGVPSRRSDLESLGYNIIYWLTGSLPWEKDCDNPEIVDKSKQKAMTDVEYFLKATVSECPTFLKDYFKYIQNLEFQEKPDYGYCKKLFEQWLKASGYKDDSFFDFENKQSCTLYKIKQISPKNAGKPISDVLRVRLQSNIPVKPSLRQEGKNRKLQKRGSWFKILPDPETILRKAREKTSSECHETTAPNVAELNIQRLNPTYAMIEVYNKCRGIVDVPHSCKGDSCLENVEGYTPAMLSVLQKMSKAKELEYEQMVVINGRNPKTSKRYNKRQKKSESPSSRSLTQVHMTKSSLVVVIKKEIFHRRKIKHIALRRTYSLRG